jgi:hypothetical protein
MKQDIKDWIAKNWKELLFFIMTWTIGWYLFFLVIDKIDPNINCYLCPTHWLIFFTSLFLLFLPFVKKITLGNIFKIEKEIKETKAELKDFKSNTQLQFTVLSSSINLLSQNLSNNITIYNRAPDAETLKEEREIVEKESPEIKTESTEIKKDLDFVEGEDEWIYNLLKLRIRIEKELRIILEKRTSAVQTDNIEKIKFYTITKLFDMYLELFPESKHLLRSFKLFSSVANAAIHGQNIDKQQYQQASGLGSYVLGDIIIKQRLDN